MPTTTTEEDANGTVAVSETAPAGKTVEPPQSGQANLWGQLNSIANGREIEVKLCETLNSFNMACGGKTYKTVTNADGEYLIENVVPKTYGGLVVKVFNSNFYVFEATQYGGMPKKYELKLIKPFMQPREISSKMI